MVACTNLKNFFRLSKSEHIVLNIFFKFYKIVLDNLQVCIYTVYIDMHGIYTEKGIQTDGESFETKEVLVYVWYCFA